MGRGGSSTRTKVRTRTSLVSTTTDILTRLQGVIYPNSTALVNRDAPKDQPWKRGVLPCQYQEYFDEVYDDLMSLRRTPMPSGSHHSYHGILYGADKEGLVSGHVLLMVDLMSDCGLQMMQKLYRANGWPDDFRKEAYLDAVRRDHPFDGGSVG